MLDSFIISGDFSHMICGSLTEAGGMCGTWVFHLWRIVEVESYRVKNSWNEAVQFDFLSETVKIDLAVIYR